MCLKCFYFVVTHFINAINLSQKRGNGQCDDAMTLCNWLMSVIWDFFSLSTSANYCDCHSNTSDEHIRPNDPRIKNETNEIFIRCLQKKKKCYIIRIRKYCVMSRETHVHYRKNIWNAETTEILKRYYLLFFLPTGSQWWWMDWWRWQRSVRTEKRKNRQ